MTLKKDVHIKIRGDFVKGTIINGRFKTEILVDLSSCSSFNAHGLNSKLLKEVIKELQELNETLEGIEVAEELTKDDIDRDPFGWSR